MKVRLEIGPQDAEQSLCIMARSQPQPGMVAHKCTGAVDDSLAAEVQRLLDMPDDQVPAGDCAKYEAKQAEEGRCDPNVCAFASAANKQGKLF